MIDSKFVAILIKDNFNITPTLINTLNTIGTMNIVYLIEFNNHKLIVRLREDDPYAKNEFLKEQWFSEQCTKLGIPVPKIFYTGKYNNVDYLIEEYINGISGNKYKNKDLIFEQLGIYSRKIKSIPISGYGIEISDYINNTFIDNFYSSPKEQLLKNIEALLPTDKLIDLDVYNSKYINYIKDSFSHLISQDLICVLNHGDISLNNTIISNNGTVYWIDFGSVNANSLYSEFANLKVENENDFVSFSKGFGISARKIKENLATYRLLNSFDKVRWALTTGNNEYINWYTKAAKHAFQTFIKNIKDQER